MTDVGEEALDLLRVPDVALRMRLSKATIWRLIYEWEKTGGRDGLESIKVGRSRCVAPEWIDAYKERQRSQRTAA